MLSEITSDGKEDNAYDENGFPHKYFIETLKGQAIKLNLVWFELGMQGARINTTRYLICS